MPQTSSGSKLLRQLPVPHVPPDRVVDLRFLQMKPRLREFVEVADVVVMHVGQDHVLHRGRIDAQQSQ